MHARPATRLSQRREQGRHARGSRLRPFTSRAPNRRVGAIPIHADSELGRLDYRASRPSLDTLTILLTLPWMAAGRRAVAAPSKSSGDAVAGGSKTFRRCLNLDDRGMD